MNDQLFSRTSSGLFAHIDWVIFLAALGITCCGLATMKSFSAEDLLFDRQLIWLSIAVGAFFFGTLFEYSFLKRTALIAIAYGLLAALLALVLGFGAIVKGSQNRFDLGSFAVQPADPAKLLLVALLAKYFARRHIEIAHVKHIVISGAYAFIFFALIFFQPDMGSAIIIFAIWLGMVLVAGISWKHLAALFCIIAVTFGVLWNFGLHDYQKKRITTFLSPLNDIHGSGYNAYQSTVAVGSGEMFGKGIGYGTQSKLRFLPEFQTDFIFASFAEEWGFVGVLFLYALFAILIVRILLIASHGADNFETLFATGIAVYISAQFMVHVGMNMSIFPITGTTLPFMSYGGSHLLTEYLALGMIMGMRRNSRPTLRAQDQTELLGAL